MSTVTLHFARCASCGRRMYYEPRRPAPQPGTSCGACFQWAAALCAGLRGLARQVVHRVQKEAGR